MFSTVSNVDFFSLKINGILEIWRKTEKQKISNSISIQIRSAAALLWPCISYLCLYFTITSEKCLSFIQIFAMKWGQFQKRNSGFSGKRGGWIFRAMKNLIDFVMSTKLIPCPTSESAAGQSSSNVPKTPTSTSRCYRWISVSLLNVNERTEGTYMSSWFVSREKS